MMAEIVMLLFARYSRNNLFFKAKIILINLLK